MKKATKGLSRRDFLKGSAAALAGVAVAGVSGTMAHAQTVSTPNRAASIMNEVDIYEDPEIPDHPVDGKYVTRAMGHESWVYVSTTIREGKIVECKVVRNNETIGVGNYACARIPAAIMQHQSVDVPNVRGCSTTSMAIKMAVEKAIEQSGYSLDDFSEPIEREMTNETIEEDCDVVICGAGTAGLFAGARLAEKGLKVILVEKRDIPGGSMPLTYGGILTTGSRRQFAYDVKGQLPGTASGDLEVKLESLKAEVLEGREVGEMPFCRVLYGVGGEMADWLSDIGVGFRTFGTFEGATSVGSGLSLAPGMYMGGVGYASMFLAERISLYDNAKIYYATKVTELIKDENGAYCGIHAEGENGNTYTIHAKAVCLTTGGFGRNQEMLAEYYPHHADQFFNCTSAVEGDGIRLGLEAGGVMEVFDDDLPAYLSSKPGYIELAFLQLTTPSIFVNTRGENIGSSMSHVNGANMKLDESNGDRFFVVFDDAAAESTRKDTSLGFDTYNALFERGEAIRYDSVEEIMEEYDLPKLQESIDAANELALSGEVNAFGLPKYPYMETRNGLWIVEVTPTFYLTTSGLRSDTECHLLDSDGNKIPGLYGAGDLIGAVEKKDGLRYSYGFDSASAFGYHMADVVEQELA